MPFIAVRNIFLVLTCLVFKRLTKAILFIEHCIPDGSRGSKNRLQRGVKFSKQKVARWLIISLVGYLLRFNSVVSGKGN